MIFQFVKWNYKISGFGGGSREWVVKIIILANIYINFAIYRGTYDPVNLHNSPVGHASRYHPFVQEEAAQFPHSCKWLQT